MRPPQRQGREDGKYLLRPASAEVTIVIENCSNAAVGVSAMTIRNERGTGSKPEKPQPAGVRSGEPTGPKPSSGAKPNSLIASSLKPVTADIRRAMIAEAAYYIAEQRGFAQGCDVDDWLRAEAQIDARLSV